MIKDVSTLLSALRDFLADQAREDSASLSHPGIIGEMYEEAAARLLRYSSAFDGLEIEIATGFIEDPAGNRSRQVDCMVCVGAGKPIALTRHRIYRAEDVLMVVEVKKTLRSKELCSALSCFQDFSSRLRWDGPCRLMRLFEKSWPNLTAKPFPEDRAAIGRYTVFERLIFRLLAREAQLPARVLFSFDGYEDEPALRSAVCRAMNRLAPIPNDAGAKIAAFPNLIVCGRSAVIKLDGFPYPGVFDEEAQTWAWMGSNSGNPFNSLLEILWTRLRARFGLSSRIFGDDLDTETVTCFGILKTVGTSSNSFGLYFHPDSEDGETRQRGTEWKPAELTEAEFHIMMGMSLGLIPDFDDPEFTAYMGRLGTSEEELIRSLRSKGIAGVSGRLLVPLVDGLKCAALEDGSYVAGDDSTGRFAAYLKRRRDER